MAQNSAINYLVDFLFQPLPFPENSIIDRFSFIHRNARDARRARRLSANARLRKGRTLRVESTPLPTRVGPLDSGKATMFSVNGLDFVITPETWIFGQVRLGAVATVHMAQQGDRIIAKKVIISS